MTKYSLLKWTGSDRFAFSFTFLSCNFLTYIATSLIGQIKRTKHLFLWKI